MVFYAEMVKYFMMCINIARWLRWVHPIHLNSGPASCSGLGSRSFRVVMQASRQNLIQFGVLIQLKIKSCNSINLLSGFNV